MQIDHVALEVADLDDRLERLAVVGLRVLRTGVRHRTGQRIVMVGDGTGVKLELIEAATDAPAFAHVAMRVADPDAMHDALVAAGWVSRSEPHDLESARARTALVADSGGLAVQLIRYDADSPDMVTWDEPGQG